jgi:anthranilate synthase component I
MAIQPDFKTFCENASTGRPQLIWMRFVADLETPVATMLKLEPHFECSFLLESVQGGESRGRYSIIALQPDLIWRCSREKAEISHGSLKNDDFTACSKPSLEALRELIHASRIEIPEALPPMAAGLIGFMGYDMVKQMEKLPDTNPDTIGIPDGCFMRPRITIVHDAVDGVITIATPVWDSHDGDKVAYDNAKMAIEHVYRLLNAPLEKSYSESKSPSRPIAFRSRISQAEYERRVEQAKEYIRAGEIFQVVPSQRFEADFSLPPFSLYRALRHLNPSPFLFYLNFGDFALIGSSPEIMVRLRNGKVTIRPIAGTRKRGGTPEEDQELERNLLADEKEIAEHLMLLDLGRNDVGRVSKPNSVRVTERMIIERYSHVMHIVSNVEGAIRDDCDAVDALMAGFPAGTVSGAPKIRAMEIIDELESERRSFYAGCVGYFSGNGSMDNCITLRTALIKNGKIYVQAGGGVVADSDPAAEYEESCNKAKAVMKAAEMAGDFL